MLSSIEKKFRIHKKDLAEQVSYEITGDMLYMKKQTDSLKPCISRSQPLLPVNSKFK